MKLEKINFKKRQEEGKVALELWKDNWIQAKEYLEIKGWTHIAIKVFKEKNGK